MYTEVTLKDITSNGLPGWRQPRWLPKLDGQAGDVLKELDELGARLWITTQEVHVRCAKPIPQELAERLERCRDEIIARIGYPPDRSQVDICRDWLRAFGEKTKTIRPSWNSYGLKHVVERWKGTYVSNGAFVAAALLEGYDIAPNGYASLNAYFNLSLRKWKAAQKAVAQEVSL